MIELIAAFIVGWMLRPLGDVFFFILNNAIKATIKDKK
jgi:hypothetical protein